MAYAKPQQRKKEESERPREAGYQIKFNNLRFERWQAVGFGKGRIMQVDYSHSPDVAMLWDYYAWNYMGLAVILIIIITINKFRYFRTVTHSAELAYKGLSIYKVIQQNGDI